MEIPVLKTKLKSTLKIGILGTRGIPNAYGGYEQFAQFLSVGLKQKGHQVWVYNSDQHPYQQGEWNGVQIIHCNDWENKVGTAGQFIYDYNCFKDARKRNFDVLLQLGYTSSSIWYLLWPKNAINLVNMDGLEWKRSKYGKLTRKFLKYAESLAAKHADILIADSKGIQEYLEVTYKKASVYIPYGADIIEHGNNAVLKNYKLRAGEYYLLIARMEPENNIEMIIQGYLATEKKHPLVIISNFRNSFGTYLKNEYPDENIKYLGAIYDQDAINTIRQFSVLYFHGHSVGGTNPSLLEAMGCSCTIAAHDNPFNKAILTGCGYYFSSAVDIAHIFKQVQDPSKTARWKSENLEKLRSIYNWDMIINEYENLFFESIATKKSTVFIK